MYESRTEKSLGFASVLFIDKCILIFGEVFWIAQEQYSAKTTECI